MDLLPISGYNLNAEFMLAETFVNTDVTRYYTYAGSLTTPNCQEAVTWIVIEKPMFLSGAQV